MGVGTLRAVFLDRDGVLNKPVVVADMPHPPSSLSELELSTGVEEGCRALKEAGFLLIGITNQPDVARGKTEKRIVEEINGYLTGRLGIDSFQVCYHDDGDDCACRKPKPGMILTEAGRRGIDLQASFMIGDRWRDVEAGRRAGCRTILIDNHYADSNQSNPTFTVNSFQEAVAVILSGKETP